VLARGGAVWQRPLSLPVGKSASSESLAGQWQPAPKHGAVVVRSPSTGEPTVGGFLLLAMLPGDHFILSKPTVRTLYGSLSGGRGTLRQGRGSAARIPTSAARRDHRQSPMNEEHKGKTVSARGENRGGQGKRQETGTAMPDLSRARERMVEVHIARRGVRDSHVLNAMRCVRGRIS
jgi:hypothetical protein